MGSHRIELITRKQKRDYVILRGKKDLLKKMVRARLYIVGSLAYAEWEQKALQNWKDKSTGWRYIEGLYWQPGEGSVLIGVKQDTLASMLEGGFPPYNIGSGLKTAAISKGGRIIVPFGANSDYYTPASSRQQIPSSDTYGTLLQKHDDNPGIVINKVSGVMQSRTITSTAAGTQPMGIFIRTAPATSYRTVTINTPAGLWKSPGYRGAMIGEQIASTVGSLGQKFMADLFPQKSVIDL